MTRDEFFWLVGLLEGEGCFSGGYHYKPNKVRIQLRMTDEDTVVKAQQMMGSQRVRSEKQRNPEHSVSYATNLEGRPAIELMHRMLPHMSNRRQKRIRELLDSYDPDLKRKNSGSRRLSENQVISIRSRSKEGTQNLAAEFNVCSKTIRDIVLRKTWTHIPF